MGGGSTSDLRVASDSSIFPDHGLTLSFRSPGVAAPRTLSGFYRHAQWARAVESHLELNSRYF